MDIVKVAEAVVFLEQKKYGLPEADRQLIVWYACKTDDKELVEGLAKELSESGCNKELVVQKYLSIMDREDPVIEDIEKLLVSVEMIRLKEEAVLDQLALLLEVNGYSVKKQKEEPEKEDAYVKTI